MIPIISITAPVMDEDGSIIIKPTYQSKYKDLSPRASRSMALDGTAVVTSNGAYEIDRSINIRSQLDKAQSDKIWYLVLNYPYLQLAIDGHVFYGAVEKISIDNGNLNLDFLIQE